MHSFLKVLSTLYSYLSFNGIVLSLIYIFYVLRLHLKDSIQPQSLDSYNIFILFLGLITTLLLGHIIRCIGQSNRILHVGLALTSFFLYLCAGTYHLRTANSLDFAVIKDNLSLITHKESLGVMVDVAKGKDIIFIFSILLIFIIIELYSKNISNTIIIKRWPLHLLLALIVYLGVSLSPRYYYDEFGVLLRSVKNYYYPATTPFVASQSNAQYPYIRNFEFDKTPTTPNIFILLVESFNANFVETKNRDDKEYTPYVNSLIKNNTYYENFFGNSIQTAKGQFATLCSLIPLMNGKVNIEFHNVNLKCLPEVMKQNGYETIFFQGYPKINFDNTLQFNKNIGFQHVYAMDSKFITPEEKKQYYWGWGVQDDITFKKFFKYLDTINQKDKTKRFFASVSTITSHTTFKHVPKKLRYIYPDQKNRYESYANTIRITDEYLETFFDELKSRNYLNNSIVYLLGDHSFPIGEHGSYSNEAGFYNEYFKTPLVVINSIDKKQRRIKDARSQLDIAPSILRDAGISTKGHFLGIPLEENSKRLIPLIQPYAGGYYSLISWPYKYVFHKQRMAEMAFNLSTDPHEEENIISTIKEMPLYDVFLKGMGTIYQNEKLIKNNLIWNEQ